MRNISKIFFAVVFAVAFILLAVISVNDNRGDGSILSENTTQEAKVNLVIEFPDQDTQTFSTSLQAGENAFELIKRVDADNVDLLIGYEEYSFGAFINEFNGVKPDPNDFFWKLQVNGQDSPQGVSDYYPVAGDELKFVLEEVKL